MSYSGMHLCKCNALYDIKQDVALPKTGKTVRYKNPLPHFDAFPNQKIFDCSKLKEFVGDNFKYTDGKKISKFRTD